MSYFDRSQTRDRIRQCILDHGPLTAIEVSRLIGLPSNRLRNHFRDPTFVIVGYRFSGKYQSRIYDVKKEEKC